VKICLSLIAVFLSQWKGILLFVTAEEKKTAIDENGGNQTELNNSFVKDFLIETRLLVKDDLR
jgi:hypothetical protein